MPRHVEGAARQRAVQVAGELFYARGLRGVSVDDVAREAGVSRVTLYSHFAGKDGLAEQVLHARDAALQDAVEEAMDAAGDDPAARVLAAFDLLAEQADRPGYRGCPFVNTAAEVPDPDHPLMRLVVAHKRALRERFRAELVRLHAADPDAAAEELMILLDGAQTRSAIVGGSAPVHAAIRLVRLLLDSRVPRPAARPAAD